ncbi:MAG: OmpA family protein [Labilithrix sp.]|nr:OmpA family protein [Labilithrix sp.]MCW5812620.1 OmpA family protein [Labilithrix sp.]
MKTILLLTVSASVLLGGCVSKNKYDQAVAQTEITRAELAKKELLLGERNGIIQQSSAELEQRKDDIAKLKVEIAQLIQLDKSLKGEHRVRIGELQRRLVQLEAAQRAAEWRAQIYKDLTLKLKKQIDDGDLELVIRQGRMVLQLPDDVLFDSGRTELKPAGKEALAAIATVLATMPGRQFQVSGHTDNVPINNARFASNWELSSGRALRVVHYLVGQGVSESVLSAAGYSETDPIATNATPDGRKKNRRTEITLQPNIDELVEIPE